MDTLRKKTSAVRDISGDYSNSWSCSRRTTSQNPVLGFIKELNGKDGATGRGAAFHLRVTTYAQRVKLGHRGNSQSPRQCQCHWDIRDPAVSSSAADGRH